MKQQTAVEWLYERLIKKSVNDINYNVLDILEQAKAMEKKQIIDAFESGVYDGGENVSQYNMNSEQYYKETFKSE